jgi:integrase
LADEGAARSARILTGERLTSARRGGGDPGPPAQARDVVLAPALAKALRERWLASRYKAPTDFVFANTLGRGLDYRDVGEGFRATVKRSGITATGRLSLHCLRHGFASRLIAKGLNVVFVSRQLGDANPTVTLSTYAHLFEQADHAVPARAALEAGYAATAGPAAP